MWINGFNFSGLIMCFMLTYNICIAAGPSSLNTYPLLSVITRQPPSSLAHIPQPSPPGRVTHLPMVSSQHTLPGEPAPSETPVSISSESETEHGTTRLKKPRRSRTIFTELQLMGLEKKFQKQKYLSTPDRSVHTLHNVHYIVLYCVEQKTQSKLK